MAFAAIVSSYFGHFLGAHEGLVGLVKSRSSVSVKKIELISLLFIVITTWIVAIINPSILGMIETMGAPMIAAILFILPVVAMRIIPAMKPFSTSKPAQIFTLLCGLASITSCDLWRVRVIKFSCTETHIALAIWGRLPTKRDKSVVFPSLCYQAKINKLIFLVNFTTLKDHFQT
ncbi:Serine transporter [Providencia alcalifaciens]|nr:Serine transporter [Providencia alcalifaciens]